MRMKPLFGPLLDHHDRGISQDSTVVTTVFLNKITIRCSPRELRVSLLHFFHRDVHLPWRIVDVPFSRVYKSLEVELPCDRTHWCVLDVSCDSSWFDSSSPFYSSAFYFDSIECKSQTWNSPIETQDVNCQINSGTVMTVVLVTNWVLTGSVLSSTWPGDWTAGRWGVCSHLWSWHRGGLCVTNGRSDDHNVSFDP
jgi:hypothetical protein